MKKESICLALLGCLLIFAFAIPFGNAAIVNGGNYTPAYETGLAPFYYKANPVTVDYDRYGGSGFLYNTVAELRRAYDLNPLYAAGYDGSGQTVVIIDAFGSPTVYDDLLSFIQWQNAHYAPNLPWTTMAQVQQHLHIYYPEGYVVFNASNSDELSWSTEVTLDVDMVHAIAPGANIALVVASSDNDVPLMNAVLFAVLHHLGSVISQSWGDPEWDIALSGLTGFQYLMYAHFVYLLAALEGMTVFASAGDWGASNLSPFYIPPGYNSPLYPASDPFVTAVGGTNLFMNCPLGYSEGTGNWTNRQSPGLTYNYEIAGNDYEAMVADGYPYPSDYVTTGGAMSAFFPLPWWQQGITMTYANGTAFTPTMRCDSDVSFDSGVYGGLGAVPWSAATPGSPIYYIVGGTSAGSPFWAALTAIADQRIGHSLGYINPMLYANRGTFYSMGAFHDITMGDNTYPTGYPLIGFEATKGWDAPTGIGSPDATKLVTELGFFR
jgi:subtilase family serine protease